MSSLGMQIGRKPKGGDKPQEKAGEKSTERPAERQVPRTLGGLPSAAPSANGSEDLLQKAAQLDGEELELFIARLPDDKRRLLESAD